MSPSMIDLSIVFFCWVFWACCAVWAFKRVTSLISFFRAPIKAQESERAPIATMATRVGNKTTRELIEEGKILVSTTNGVKFIEGPTKASIQAANDAFMEVPEVQFKQLSDEEINRLIERWMIPNPRTATTEYISDIDYQYPADEHIDLK